MKSFVEEYKAGGLIKFRVRARKVVDGKAVKVHVGVFTTREEAERAAAAAHIVVANEHHQIGPYLESVLTRMGAKPSYWSLYRTHIAPDEICQRHVATVKTSELREFFERLQAKNVVRVTTVVKATGRETTTETLDRKLAYRTCENAFNLLRTMFRWAKTEDLVDTLPTKGILLPKKKTTETHGLALRPQQQQALIQAVDGPEKWIVAFAIYTGLRAWELCSLHWEDVTLGKEPHIWVRYGGPPKKLANGKEEWPSTKGGEPRKVPLIPAAEQALRNWRKSSKDWFREPAGIRRDYLVFPAREYQLRSGTHVLRWEKWKKAIERAGIPASMRWHDLRHTCGTSLLHGWWGHEWTLDGVQGFLGHKESSTTQAYLHKDEDKMAQAARRTRHAGEEIDAEEAGVHGGSGGQSETELPHNLPHGNFDAVAKSLISLAPPAGIEPAANGLGKSRTDQRDQQVSSDLNASFAPWLPHAMAARGAALAFDVAVMSTDVQRVFVALEGLLYAADDLASRAEDYAHLSSIVQSIRKARSAGRDQLALTLGRSLVSELQASSEPAAQSKVGT